MPEDKAENTPHILQNLVAGDKTAKECIDAYGNLIWKLAKQYTDSEADAEEATLEIFKDIWQYRGKYNSSDDDEASFIVLIAKRGLMKRKGV